jgi:hypothetical protein
VLREFNLPLFFRDRKKVTSDDNPIDLGALSRVWSVVHLPQIESGRVPMITDEHIVLQVDMARGWFTALRKLGATNGQKRDTGGPDVSESRLEAELKAATN